MEKNKRLIGQIGQFNILIRKQLSAFSVCDGLVTAIVILIEGSNDDNIIF